MTSIGTQLVWLAVYSANPLAVTGFTSLEVFLWGLILVSGFLGAIGGLYLLSVDTIIVHYTRFFKIISIGLLLFVLTAPVVFFLSIDFIHAIHGFAAFVISIGLYTIIQSKQTES